MWEGKVTEELRELFRQYIDQNQGMAPDEYDDVYYDAMTYEEFVGYIKEALRRHCDIEEAMDKMAEE